MRAHRRVPSGRCKSERRLVGDVRVLPALCRRAAACRVIDVVRPRMWLLDSARPTAAAALPVLHVVDLRLRVCCLDAPVHSLAVLLAVLLLAAARIPLHACSSLLRIRACSCSMAREPSAREPMAEQARNRPLLHPCPSSHVVVSYMRRCRLDAAVSALSC